MMYEFQGYSSSYIGKVLGKLGSTVHFQFVIFFALHASFDN